MARDYEDLHNIEELDDNELRELVREQLRDHASLDIDEIVVQARQGKVTLSGRVGSEGERRVAEHVLTDVLGVEDFDNDLVVDSLARPMSPDAADDSIEEDDDRSGALLGDMVGQTSDEAAHLPHGADDDLGGTADMQRAITDGMSYNPPTSPTQEGFAGSDADGTDLRGERH